MKYRLKDPFQVKQANEYYEHLKKIEADITIVRSSKRTPAQNSYLHVIINLFACHFGLTNVEAKTDLKRACPFMRYEKNGKTYLIETSKQNVELIKDFISWIRNYSSQEGCYLPSGDEYRQATFYYDQIVDTHRQYL